MLEILQNLWFSFLDLSVWQGFAVLAIFVFVFTLILGKKPIVSTVIVGIMAVWWGFIFIVFPFGVVYKAKSTDLRGEFIFKEKKYKTKTTSYGVKIHNNARVQHFVIDFIREKYQQKQKCFADEFIQSILDNPSIGFYISILGSLDYDFTFSKKHYNYDEHYIEMVSNKIKNDIAANPDICKSVEQLKKENQKFIDKIKRERQSGQRK